MLKELSLQRQISFYLLLSYGYYERDESLFSDLEFDDLCKILLEKFDEVQSSNHPNKDLITKQNLQCGTGYNIKFTERIKSSYESFRKEYEL